MSKVKGTASLVYSLLVVWLLDRSLIPCGESACKSRDAARYSFGIVCLGNLSMRTEKTGDRECSTIAPRPWDGMCSTDQNTFHFVYEYTSCEQNSKAFQAAAILVWIWVRKPFSISRKREIKTGVISGVRLVRGQQTCSGIHVP